MLDQQDAAVVDRSHTALERLRRMISQGELGESGRLPPERDLAERLGVGRRSLRRALGVLEDEGQILRRQGQGTFVRDEYAPLNLKLGRISELTNPIEIMETRLALEPAATRLAAIRASRRDIERLSALASDTRATRTPAEYERANTAFHRRIVEAARNTLYLALFDAVNEILRDLACDRLTESGHCFNRQSVYSDFHDQIVSALAARDGERAGACMYAHLRDVQQNLLARVFPAADEA